MKISNTPNGMLLYYNAQRQMVTPSTYIGSNVFLTRALMPINDADNTYRHVGWVDGDISKKTPAEIDIILDSIWTLLADIKKDLDEPIDEHFITEDFYIWPAGTYVLDIWAWFDKHYSEGLGKRHFN